MAALEHHTSDARAAVQLVSNSSPAALPRGGETAKGALVRLVPFSFRSSGPQERCSCLLEIHSAQLLLRLLPHLCDDPQMFWSLAWYVRKVQHV